MKITEQQALESIWSARKSSLEHRDRIDELLTWAELSPDVRAKLTRAANLLEQAHSVLNATA